MNLPNPPSTSHVGLDLWLARLHDAVRGMWLRNTPDLLLERTPQGTLVRLARQKSGIKAGLYRFKSMTSEYLVCRSFNGTTEGTTDVNIAKTPKLRGTVLTETLRGVVVNYTAYDFSLAAQTRVATQAGTGGITETQYITPPYLVNDLIYAIPATTLVSTPPTGTPPVAQPVGLLDLNIDAREWAAF